MSGPQGIDANGSNGPTDLPGALLQSVQHYRHWSDRSWNSPGAGGQSSKTLQKRGQPRGLGTRWVPRKGWGAISRLPKGRIPAYGALMMYRTAVPRSGPPAAHLLLVALLLVSTGVTWTSPILGPHCNSHTITASSPSAHGEHDSEAFATASWTSGSDHGCSHCPPSDCSRLAPCATSGSVAVAEAGTPITDLLPHPVSLTRHIQQHRSTAVPPPTPPPQPIA